MVDSGMKIFDPREVRAEFLEHALTNLDKAGVRLTFPEHVHAAQTLWPENCPLSDQELRAELRSLRSEIDLLSRRAKELHDRLPDPYEFQHDDIDEVPVSVYFMLTGALGSLFDDGLRQPTETIEKALAATPEGIRADWLKRQLSNQRLDQLIPAPADDPPGALT